MEKRRVVLTFPPNLVDQAVTYHLVKDYDLALNILSAKVKPNEEGRLVVEFKGKKSGLNKGIAYLKELGVKVEPLARDVKWHEDKCTHCTVCVPICSPGALALDREKMLVSFERDKCIACELCVMACPYKAIEILF